MNKRIRILLDVDGVLADFVGHTMTLLDGLGIRLPNNGRDGFNTWDLLDVLPSNESRSRCAWGWRERGWCVSMPPYPGAQQAVANLRTHADIVFVTAPMPYAPNWMFERTQWLMKEFDAKAHEIVHTTGKHNVWGDVLVEDKPSNLEEWLAEHPNGTGILCDAPYNRNWIIPDTLRIIRTNDWANELYRISVGGRGDHK